MKKRIICIEDLSSFGHCSLAVAYPILSCQKIQVVALPTMILSTHTGGLNTPVIANLGDFSIDSVKHYDNLELKFDGVYTGYLGNVNHINNTINIFKRYPNVLKFVDPVMGDHGKAYKLFDEKTIQLMKELVRHADVITPNLTEVSLLLDIEYKNNRTIEEYKQLLNDLHKLGPKFVIITGARHKDGISNFCFDGINYYQIDCNYIDIQFPGTGDIFASVIFGSMVNEKDVCESIQIATDFVEQAITETINTEYDTRYGVDIENCLDYFYKKHDYRGYKII